MKSKIAWHINCLSFWLCGWAAIAQGLIEILSLGFIHPSIVLAMAKWNAGHLFAKYN